MQRTPDNAEAFYLPFQQALLAFEVVITHSGLFTTVHRINLTSKFDKSLLSIAMRIDRHDVLVNVWTCGPLPLKVHRLSMLLPDDA